MNKLAYTKIGNDTLAIDLHNGYTIIAIELFNYETKKYEVAFYIKDNTVNILDLIDKQQKVEFDTDHRFINSAVLKHIATLLTAGFYDYYIERYEYMMKCFDKGTEFFEKERCGSIDD
jgi:hypothetical protein